VIGLPKLAWASALPFVVVSHHAWPLTQILDMDSQQALCASSRASVASVRLSGSIHSLITPSGWALRKRRISSRAEAAGNPAMRSSRLRRTASVSQGADVRGGATAASGYTQQDW
jgi:hypothetical protein